VFKLNDFCGMRKRTPLLSHNQEVVGRVFRSESFNGEESARSAARHECEHTSGRTCSDTISVPNEWDVIVLRCGSRNFLGGSAPSVGMAYY